MKKLMVGISLLAVLLFQNCAEPVAFQEEALKLSSVGPSSETFKVNFVQNTTLDMVWVIDNSGSMDVEAAIVRNNLPNFLSVLGQKTNFRFLLISNNTTYGASLPAGLPESNYRYLNVTTDSYNSPEILLTYLKQPEQINFFRANSQKVVVFVTDDNSTISAQNFLDGLTGSLGWPLSQVMVSSFTGLGFAESSCQWATGTNYSLLAQMTGGRAYNICAADWTPHFSDLLNKSISQAQRRFTFKSSAMKEILSVTVDGQPIDVSQYFIEGSNLVLQDNVFLTQNSTVTVTYSLVQQ